jgi:hypothetical protein
MEQPFMKLELPGHIFCKKKNRDVEIKHKNGLPVCMESSLCFEFKCILINDFNDSADPEILQKVKRRHLAKIIFAAAALVVVVLIVFVAIISSPGNMTDAQLIERLSGRNGYLSVAIELANRKNPVALTELETFLKSDLWDERRDAAMALGKLGDKRAAPALYELLGDSNTDVLEAVAAALGELQDATTVETLLKALNDRPRADRWALARAYSKIRDERAIPALIDALDSDIITKHREMLASALSNQGEKAILLLIDSMLNGGPGAWELAYIELQNNEEIDLLHDAITNKDLKMLARTYTFFLCLDQDDLDHVDERLTTAEKEVLASALLAYGDKDMAEVFVNFYRNSFFESTILAEAAYKWADEHGYTFVQKK